MRAGARRTIAIASILTGLAVWPTVAQDADAPAPAAGAAESESAAEDADMAPVRLANGTEFGAWVVTCEAIGVGETTCLLSQRLVRTSDSAFLAELVAFWDADLSQSFLAAYVPVGVYLPSGFAFRAEESEERFDFAWQSCTRELCEALLPLDGALETLDTASSLIIGYRPDSQSEPLIFSTGATGLAEGLDALRQALSATK